MGRGDIYGSRVFWVADPESGKAVQVVRLADLESDFIAGIGRSILESAVSWRAFTSGTELYRWAGTYEQGARDAFTVVRRRLGLDEAGTS